MPAGYGQTRIIDTTGWSLVVPLRPAVNLAGFRLTARLAGAFGGVVADLDSAIEVPGYGGAHEIDWTADANGVTDRLILTVTPTKRGDWLATDLSGRPAQITVFADVLYTVAGSARAPEPLGRTGFLVMPATNSPLVVLPAGPSPVLIAGQVGQVATTTAMQIGPQGPPGPQGPAAGGAGSAQIFTQATPAATWTIPHGFGRRPLTAVFDAAGNEMIADIAAGAAAVTVTFAQPTAGSAVLA